MCNRMNFCVCISGDLPVRWGHIAITTSHQQVILAGGTGGQPVDSIDILHNANNICSLAQNLSQCHIISDCISCVNETDNSLIGCYGTANFSSWTCRSLGGKQGWVTSVDFTNGCESFATCDSCLTTDLALGLDCSWCTCNNSTSCTASSKCSCNPINATAPEVCLLDICRYPSCGDCLRDDRCSWLANRVLNATSISREFMEWGCYKTNISESVSKELNFNISINDCPMSCSSLLSCDACVSSSSPQGGALTCVWSTYSKECMSENNIPLLCAGGKCGAIATEMSQCVLGCSRRLSCEQCQTLPQCRWKTNQGCVDIAYLKEVQIGTQFECPRCGDGCTEHGHCLSTGQCVCQNNTQVSVSVYHW